MRDEKGRWVAHSEVSVGDKFSRWTVLEKAGMSGTLYSHASYLCLCECGTKRVVEGFSLTSGNSKSCGCFATDNARKRLRTKPYWALYKRLKDQVKITRKEVSITYDEFLEFTKITMCTYCGAPVIWSEWAYNNKNIGGYNLDRKDNSKGYHKDNVVVCCGDCNWTRGDRFTYEEFMLIARVIRHIYKLRRLP